MRILIYISSIGCVSHPSMDSTDLEIVFKGSGPSIFLDFESPGTPSPVATISPSVKEEPLSTTYQSKAAPAVPERGAHESRVGCADYNLTANASACTYTIIVCQHSRARMCIHRYIHTHLSWKHIRMYDS